MTKLAAACRALLALAALAAALPLAARADGGDGRDGDAKVLDFDTMAAVVAPFLGAAGTIDGIPAGGAAWKITRGRGELRANGRLRVEVEGLVLVGTGANPFTSFVAFVACFGTAPVQTGPFPTGPEGNARIEETIALPAPCFAPAVLVGVPASPTRPLPAWFASTGR